jgi:hypothetical protein
MVVFKEGMWVTPKSIVFLGMGDKSYLHGQKLKVLYVYPEKDPTITLECKEGWEWKENYPRDRTIDYHKGKHCWNTSSTHFDILNDNGCKYSCVGCGGKCGLWEKDEG